MKELKCYESAAQSLSLYEAPQSSVAILGPMPITRTADDRSEISQSQYSQIRVAVSARGSLLHPLAVKRYRASE